MISIISVNFNAYDFLDLMIESLAFYSHAPYELIVIDNSTEKRTLHSPRVHQFFMHDNIGHGRGLNHGVSKAYSMFPDNPFLMFLDVDCHILRHGWEVPLINKMKHYDLLGGKGVSAKPIRPACMFMKKEIGKYDWCDTKAYGGHRINPSGYDVGILAYYRMQADGCNVGFLDHKKNRYGTLNGEEFAINGIPLVYHHWHGAHLKERQVDFPNSDLFADKAKLFSQIPWRLP
jgi:glycosyltransferase involved in cell wall biosynthesis